MSHYRPKKSRSGRGHAKRRNYRASNKKNRSNTFSGYEDNKYSPYSNNNNYYKKDSFKSKSGDMDFLQMTLKGLGQVTKEGLIALKDIIFNKRKY